jgi:uncharacterized protein YggU (UPF0235/DUF167 family)
VDGAATNEVLAVLASAFGVRPSAVHCVRGATSHRKSITIEGDGDELTARLQRLLDD